MSVKMNLNQETQQVTGGKVHGSPRLVALLLFLIALAPRLPGLAQFLTTDESYFIFSAGSNVITAFLGGDLRGTYWHYYPGVTLSWLETIGMTGQYLLATLANNTLPPFTEYIYGDVLSLLVANRLPFVLLTAAAVPAIYLLARQLLPNRVALLGALFIAFDPFYLAHSRVAHGDAPVTVFMSLSALSFFIYLQRIYESANLRTHRADVANSGSSLVTLALWVHHSSFTNPYLLASAIFGGLAALTKAPGQFMAFFIIGMSLLYASLEIWYTKKRLSRSTSSELQQNHSSRITHHVSRIILFWLVVIIIWGGISLAVFILLWPSMWVDPLGTFRQMWDETFGKVNEGHLVYFFGQPTLNPGPWFYTYVIPFRLTPIILVGSALSLLLLIPKFKLPHTSQEPKTQQTPKLPHSQTPTSYLSPHLLLWLFTVALFLFGNLSPKKQDRYLLPLFPFFSLLAAIGWLGLFDLTHHFLKSSIANSSDLSSTRLTWAGFLISNLAILILLGLHLTPILTYYPYYLTYFNPLMGGPSRAAQTTLMGWGEGMEQVAAYLNTKPNAEELYVASTPSQALLPYFAGTGENFYTNDIAFRADYVVLYLAQMQRLAPSPEIVRYFEVQQPEKTIAIKDVTYAKIYPGPKFILTNSPPDATPINIGLDNVLRLAGYKFHQSQPETSSEVGQRNLNLTLYWHALAPLPVNYTVSVRARTVDGRILSQQDQWPVSGLLPTSQWRQGDYVVDTHTLELSGAEASQVSEFEVVVYNADTGETLGPSITINNEQ